MIEARGQDGSQVEARQVLAARTVRQPWTKPAVQVALERLVTEVRPSLVIDVSSSHDEPLVLINPEIVSRSDELVVAEEGCLSVPAIYDSVERHARVEVRALGRDGERVEFEAEELLAVCVQHEMDHLVGKVFVEYLSLLKRGRIRTKLLKRQREERRGA